MIQKPSQDPREVFIDAAIRFLSGRIAPGRAGVRAKGGTLTRGDLPRAESLGIRMVADLAGRNPATLLFHFPDRESLMAAIAARAFELLVHLLEHEPAAIADRCRIVGVTQRYVTWGIDNPGLFTAMYDPSLARGVELVQLADDTRPEDRFAVAGEKSEIGRKRARAFSDLLQAKQRALTCFVDAFEADRAGGVVRDVDASSASHGMTALADGLVWQWITERQGTPVMMRRHADAVIVMMVKGLRLG